MLGIVRRQQIYILIFIIILSFVLRVYKLDSAPPSISWDEAAVGVNSWDIANYGRDEYGKFLPVFFRSFGDDKHPIHIYITAFFVKFLGLNEFSIRIPSTVFGTLNVLLIFLLGKILFKKNEIGLSAALFLAISPYAIHFSHFNHEANFALFFFMLGFLLFYSSFNKSKYLPFSVLSFCITFITYHPAKIIVPAMGLILAIMYFKTIKKDKNFLLACFVVLFFGILIFINPELLGFARINQTAQGITEVEKTKLYKLTHNGILGRINLIFMQYSWHFTPQYLFIKGDKNARLSSQTGEFYKLDAIFLLLGLIYLLHKRSKESVAILAWALIAPLPAALVAEAPHAARSMFMMGSWHIISALGFYSIITLVRKPIFKFIVLSVTVIILSLGLKDYLKYYYGEYAKRYAIDWQYGMKQIVDYVKDNEQYNEVFMTDVRAQPYIFFLYYLKYPLPKYLNTVIYNNSESLSYNNVSNFDRYYFDGWDPIESFPNKGVLYIVSPSQYDGLRHKQLFEVKKKIVYPNGTDAFFIISAK